MEITGNFGISAQFLESKSPIKFLKCETFKIFAHRAK